MVQELVHVDDGKVIMSSGIVLPGHHTLGRAGNGNHFIVTSNFLVINGETVNSGYDVTIDPKEEVVIFASVRGSYVRHYEYPESSE